jgi:hypothetical protein
MKADAILWKEEGDVEREGRKRGDMTREEKKRKQIEREEREGVEKKKR